MGKDLFLTIQMHSVHVVVGRVFLCKVKLKSERLIRESECIARLKI